MTLRQFLLATLFLFAATGCQFSLSGQSLDANAFKKQLDGEPSGVVLDVRTAGEFSGNHLPVALNVDYNADSFETAVSKLDKSKSYYVYCLSGGRSSSAANYMRSNGFTKVYDLKGGIMAWQRGKMPVVSGGQSQPAVDKISLAEWQHLINKPVPVLIDFYAPWCTPCREIAPVLTDMEKEYAGKAEIIRINYDENKGLAEKLGVTGIPLFKIYQRGNELWKHDGAADKQTLKSALDEAISAK